MFLTQRDLQAVGDLIEQKLERKLGKKLEYKFKQKLAPIRRDLRMMKRTLEETIAFFDRRVIGHAHRLDRLENHVGLPKMFPHD